MNPLEAAFWKRARPREARAALVEVLHFELLGPSEPEEVLEESPLTRYLVGMLAPFGTLVAPEDIEDFSASGDADEEPGTGRDVEDQQGEGDRDLPMSQALSPSSIGLSCLVAETTAGLRVQASWGDYVRADREGADGAATDQSSIEEEPSDDGAEKKKRRPPQRWRRMPATPDAIDIQLAPDAGLKRSRASGDDEIWIEHLTRRIGGALAVSVFLVNRRAKPDQGRSPANDWIFQPQLVVRGVEPRPVFLPREHQSISSATDRDLESNALMYRDRREFAVGHGTAVAWESAGADAANVVSTCTLPDYELARVEPRTVEGAVFDMAQLAMASSGEELEQLLAPLVARYRIWIAQKEDEIEALPDELRATAQDHAGYWSQTATRIESAIALLRDDSVARKAFCFANEAMLLQRSHTEWASDRQDDPAAASAQPTLSGTWRPFQLAFILLTLQGIAKPSHWERQIGDLLWFPTGGGKTEAYLGLAAFTFGLRRLREVAGYRSDAGVAVLMRYTLRLLTIQQFQRATTLLCACEVLRRRDEASWGKRRFTIGLWLGRQATPNRHEDSRRALTRLRVGETDDRSNPCQLESCPWCGENLQVTDYSADSDAFRTRAFCPRDGCEFGEGAEPLGLPVVVVDDEIYRECPTLVIATVDKFAQMPWKGEVQALFGHVDRECTACGFLTPDCDHPSTHRGAQVLPTVPLVPPELIIQDELHLISGPLGTMVGLYETAVDALAARMEDETPIAPKLVASTATIRRAYEQIRSLFDRDLRVFPPLGLEPDDSFFAVEQSSSDEAPGRLYLGVMAPGKSMKTALIRVSAALLSGGAGLATEDASLTDPYLTLVAYFNSIRELGGAVRLLDDDVLARLNQLEERGLPKRNRPVYAEMTSRVTQAEIPKLLRQLKTPHDAPRGKDDRLPLDAILASNMISVGVDVNRLGLMTVLGQPKTTAEYIQATSRVGRQRSGPGLVVTIYNWVRPRDISHLERFTHYHETLYRHVEAVSVTPFSARARDRGLAGTFVALHRLRDYPLAPEERANLFDPDAVVVRIVADLIARRATHIVSDSGVVDELRNEMQILRDQWGDLSHAALRYGWRHPIPDKNPPPTEVLMKAAEGGLHGHWRVPGSLREVENQSLVYLRGVNAPSND